MTLNRLLGLPFLGLIRLYQLTLSPLLGARCRYHPSCSRYGYTAIERFGPILGAYLAGYRILRCNPFTPGGVDEVPPVGTPWKALLTAPHHVGRAAVADQPVDESVDKSGIAPAA